MAAAQPLLSGILDSMPYAVTSVEPDGTIRFVNASAAENLASTRARAMGTSLYDYFPERATATRERIRQTVERRTPQEFEAVVTLPDGRERHFYSTYCPEFDARGRVIGIQIVAKDVTLPRPAEKAQDIETSLWDRVSDDLSMTADRVKAILKTVPLIVSIHDPDTTIRYVNRVPEGLDINEVIGSRLALWLTKDSCAVAAAAYERVVTTQQVVDYRAEALSGRRWLARVAPLVHDGEVKQLLACTLDITEQSRLEEQVLHKQKIESLGTMAGGVAHDFNNLLTAITGNTGLAQSWLNKGRDPRSFLDNIEVAARRAAELCAQMLAYAGQDRPTLTPGDLNQVIGDMAQLTRAAVNARIQTTFDLAPKLPNISCSPSRLSQVVLNLVNNAADAIGDQHGRITIRTECVDIESGGGGDFLPAPPAPGRYVRMQVTDTGHGLKPETIRRIFDPFYSTKTSGHGLGLSAVLGIISSHGGAISVASSIGRGTSMTVVLPAEERSEASGQSAEPERAERTQLPESAPARARGFVLVVDDEPQVRDVLRTVLGEAGHQVAQAADGDEALTLLQGLPESVTAIILDVTMPKRDGYSTLRELRKTRPQVPVFLSSGRELEIDAGIDPFLHVLPKPYRLEEVLQAIDALETKAGSEHHEREHDSSQP